MRNPFLLLALIHYNTMFSSSNRVKISSDFDEALSILDDISPNGVTSVFELLHVVEYQIETGIYGTKSGVVTVQFIVNPWAWPNLIPTVDLVGVYIREPSEAILIDSTVGRYRLTDNGSSLREWWANERSMTDLFDAVSGWISIHHNLFSFPEGHPQPLSMGFGLCYPRGIAELLVQLSIKAERDNLNLLDANGHPMQTNIQRALEAVRNDLPPPRDNSIIQGEIQAPLEGGHFHLTGLINGVPIRFMVDTGATNTILCLSDALRVGIDVYSLQPNSLANTADGVVQLATTILPEIQFETLIQNDVHVSIPFSQLNGSLLGMELLCRFSSVEIRDNILRIVP